jgi:hypothetical protein
MKQLKQPAAKAEKNVSFNLNPLGQKVAAAKKAAEKALEEHKTKVAEYETACSDKTADKITLYRLAAAVKIARFKYKIKRAESKLAKFELKVGRKKQKKAKEVEPAMA